MPRSRPSSPSPPSSRPEKFPASVYAETVLAVNFADARRYFLDALLEIHAAHALMLARQGIVSRREALAYLAALGKLDRQAIGRAVYDGSREDLFFYIENLLAEGCSADVAGKMHTARSRNDIDITQYRMALRRQLLDLAEDLQRARNVLVELAARHVGTVMPAHTHTQPAQPTTLAHYLLGMIEALGRDGERLRQAFATVNRNPLGACAITTTGFPIDREQTARLLGFEGLQLNSYGAIASIDYVTEAMAALAVAMVNLGKLTQDLLLWCTAEFGFLRLSDGYVQSSSIMPQKRNPVALEHTRVLASKALGQAQAVFTCAHNTPFGDINDSEDDLQPLVFGACADGRRALRLLAGVLERASFDRQRMRERAGARFLTVTELADTLVRRERVSFRNAHGLVAAAVRAAGDDDRPERLAAETRRLAPKLLGRGLQATRTEILRALDPVHFVRVRNVAGGPAPSAVAAQIAAARDDLEVSAAWLQAKRRLCDGYPALLRREATRLQARERNGH